MSEAENIVDAPKKKRTGRYILISVCAVFAAIVVAVITLVFMLFTSPKAAVTVQPDAVDYFNQSRIVQKVYRQLRKTPDQLNSIRLSEKEVNSIIRCAVYMHENFSKQKTAVKLSSMNLIYKNGAFSGVIPFDTGCRFLNGGVIEISFTAKVSKKAEQLEVNVLTAKAGKIQLPSDKVNEFVRRSFESDNVKKRISQLNQIVEDISVEPDGKLKLTYYPQNFIYAVIKN